MAINKDREKVMDRFNHSENFVAPMFERFKKYYSLYRSYRENDDSTFSNLFIPQTFSTIEQIIPRIVAAIIGSNPPFSVSPRKPKDVESAKAMELLINWQLQQINFQDSLVRIFKDAFIYGTGFAKAQWQEDIELVNGIEEYQYLGPTFDYISPFTFFPDPHCESIEDALYVIENYFTTKKELKRWEEQEIVGPTVGGKSISNLDNDFSGPEKQEKFKRLRRIGMAGSPGHDDTRDWVEIHEYWEDDKCIIVANENTVIKNMENPFENKVKPYFEFRDYRVGDEFYGIGEVEIIEDLQEEINTQRNQRIDVRNLSINPILQAAPGSMIDEDDLNFAPGEIWHVDPGSVQPFALPDTGTAAVEEEMLSKQDIKETTSVTDIVKGSATNNTPDTATGINTLDTNASTRFNMKVRNFDEALKSALEHMSRMNQQYMIEEFVVRLTGNVEEYLPDDNELVYKEGGFSFMDVTQDRIVGNFDYDVKGAKSVTQTQRQQKFMQILQLAGNFQTEINIKEVLKKLLESLEVTDIRNILNVNKEQIQRLQQAQQKGQSQMQKPDEARQNIIEESETSRQMNAGNMERDMNMTGEQAEQELMAQLEGAMEGGV
ncbi:MAG: hypothetical protein K9L56_14225 [Clostridiales bacterium]|nr:hypothetical protein [Clostridiales bacterium]